MMFPFDKIKVDKSFTQNLTKRTECAAIIAATLTLARSLDIATTAEGVETVEQYRLLRLAGVTLLQGYLFQPPSPSSGTRLRSHIQTARDRRCRINFASDFSAEDRRNRSVVEKGGATPHQSLIDELEASISQRNIGSRAEILRQITDLFVAGSGHFDDEQMALFDDVMNRLVNEIDQSARVTFGETLAAVEKSPPKVTRTLALDDLIRCRRARVRVHLRALTTETSIAGAKTKGQDHLLAISQRAQLSENVTDVLVERGNKKVVISTAANAGARFSDFGYSRRGHAIGE